MLVGSLLLELRQNIVNNKIYFSLELQDKS